MTVRFPRTPSRWISALGDDAEGVLPFSERS